MISYLIIGSVVVLFLIGKGDLVLFFSENRTPFWNSFFLTTNQLGEEYMYAVGFFVLLLFVKIRYALFVPLVGGFTALFSFLLKQIFAHPRPKLWFENLEIAVNYMPDFYTNVGLTSFPSGHTFSAFATFGYFALVAKSPVLKVVFCCCAMLGGLSRVYLAQHFFEDIVFGGFCGIVLALAIYFLQTRLQDDNTKWWNRRVLN